MIRQSLNHKNHPVLSSDRWHVLRAVWTGEADPDPLYRRTIVSEHEDRASAADAAREIAASFAPEMAGRTRETRDQVLVRRPGYRSLELGRRARPRRK